MHATGLRVSKCDLLSSDLNPGCGLLGCRFMLQQRAACLSALRWLQLYLPERAPTAMQLKLSTFYSSTRGRQLTATPYGCNNVGTVIQQRSVAATLHAAHAAPQLSPLTFPNAEPTHAPCKRCSVTATSARRPTRTSPRTHAHIRYTSSALLIQTKRQTKQLRPT